LLLLLLLQLFLLLLWVQQLLETSCTHSKHKSVNIGKAKVLALACGLVMSTVE
jgi:hypothetical protein